jgi:cell division septation protein DedD
LGGHEKWREAGFAPEEGPTVRGITEHSQPAPRGRAHRLALVVASILVAFVLASSAPAAQSGAPRIESVGSAVGGEVSIGAHINPEGLETTYEIGLECSPCGSGDQWAKGTLPAVEESRTVTLTLTGVLPGRHWFAVRASNADGEESRRSEAFEVPSSPAPFPGGAGGSGIVESELPEAVNNELKVIAIREDEQRIKVKEQEEQKARELAAPPTTELQHPEEQPPAAATQTEPPACRVPALKGDTLPAARRALRRAHCRLGAVHRPARHRSVLRVRAQGASAGKRLAHNARVALWLGVSLGLASSALDS